jgi:hypothetical protein
MGGEALPVLEHKITCDQQFESSNVLDCKIVEETNKPSQQANQKNQCPFQNNILKYLLLLSGPPILLEKIVLHDSETSNGKFEYRNYLSAPSGLQCTSCVATLVSISRQNSIVDLLTE